MGCNCGRRRQEQITSANLPIPDGNSPRPDMVDAVAEQLVAASSARTVATESGTQTVVSR